MEFEWDEAKDRANRDKHGISFSEAIAIFSGPVLTLSSPRLGVSEQRLVSYGWLQHVRIVAVVHVGRDGRTRIISARPAKRKERVLYNGYRAR